MLFHHQLYRQRASAKNTMILEVSLYRAPTNHKPKIGQKIVHIVLSHATPYFLWLQKLWISVSCPPTVGIFLVEKLNRPDLFVLLETSRTLGNYKSPCSKIKLPVYD